MREWFHKLTKRRPPPLKTLLRSNDVEIRKKEREGGRDGLCRSVAAALDGHLTLTSPWTGPCFADFLHIIKSVNVDIGLRDCLIIIPLKTACHLQSKRRKFSYFQYKQVSLMKINAYKRI